MNAFQNCCTTLRVVRIFGNDDSESRPTVVLKCGHTRTPRFVYSLLTLTITLVFSTALRAEPLAASADFPGGSAVVQGIDQEQRVVRIIPAQHKDRGWPCWWYVKISGIEPGETITLDVGEGFSANWSRPDRAAYRTEESEWTQTPPGERIGKRIVYKQQVDAREARFAWGPAFVPSDAAELTKWAAEKLPHAEAFTLCETRAGRPVPALRIKQPGSADEQRRGIWIQARQHAWESGSSWVCRGLVEWIVSDDARAEALRKQSLITIVPIMDIDNVAIGAGGKNQQPQDHNRDWTDEPHWRSVAEAIKQIEQLDAAGRFDLFIDLHNPGSGSKHPFFYCTPRELLSPRGKRNVVRFLDSARKEMTGPFGFKGQVLESGASYDKRWKAISKNWVSMNTSDHVVAVTLETAWNTPHSHPDGYRTVGRQLGLAVERYLRGDVRKAVAP